MSCKNPVFKMYTGLSEQFEYCDACGVKKSEHEVSLFDMFSDKATFKIPDLAPYVPLGGYGGGGGNSGGSGAVVPQAYITPLDPNSTISGAIAGSLRALRLAGFYPRLECKISHYDYRTLSLDIGLNNPPPRIGVPCLTTSQETITVTADSSVRTGTVEWAY